MLRRFRLLFPHFTMELSVPWNISPLLKYGHPLVVHERLSDNSWGSDEWGKARFRSLEDLSAGHSASSTSVLQCYLTDYRHFLRYYRPRIWPL